jgi:hypothetical protein
MRASLAAPVFLLCAVLSGCPSDTGDSGGDDVFGPGSGSGPCRDDTDCSGGAVCARDSQCYSAAQVRDIHVRWTLRGQPADAGTCADAPDLEISISSSSGASGALGFSPVPCRSGKFSVDKAPRSLDTAALWRDGGRGEPEMAAIDRVTGDALIDLPY